ncbi:MAG TPA: hypothetical protein VEB22_03820 [Phycisphaerales bacterium]|nr:hypothetical protein [Phycisphaerales bacterium]
MIPLVLEAFGWTWIGLGVLTGAVLGVFFRRPDFLGGYDAWSRRLVRLGHIAFFGTGILCVLMASTLERRGELFHSGDIGSLAAGPAVMMAAGAALMPVICGLTAWKRKLTPVFVLPVTLIGAAVTWVYVALWGGV